MSRLFLLLLLPLVSLAAWWMTALMRRHALARGLIDVPNERSSHVSPTPRGGGVAIVCATVCGFVILGCATLLSWRQIVGLVGGGVVVAGVGFADDSGQSVPVRLRLACHFAAAAWLLFWLGGLPPMTVGGSVVQLGWAGDALALLYLVWLLNLSNFMDGIDGIAGVEAVTVSFGGAFVYLVAAPGSTAWITPLILAAATIGFLVWNWPPATIFMGDAGSGFFGLMLGALSLQAARVAPQLFWSWLIFLGVFIVDATVTLLRRLARGDRIYEAHRSHAYQHAAARCESHQPVTLAVAAINLFWLTPVAYLVAAGRIDGLVGLAIAYVPLIVAAVCLKAGVPFPRVDVRVQA